MTKNLAGKTRPIENPYEIWTALGGLVEWRVLRKYQTPDKEAANPYARWLCAVRTPHTNGGWEIGDTYVSDIKNNAIKVK